MTVHHLNCAEICPYAFVLSGSGGLFSRSRLIVHCLLVETDDGLLLVDSGYGLRDYSAPTPLVRAFTWISGTRRAPELSLP